MIRKFLRFDYLYTLEKVQIERLFRRMVANSSYQIVLTDRFSELSCEKNRHNQS
jgi:hypothetical protein